jgi:hypothetical protein
MDVLESFDEVPPEDARRLGWFEFGEALRRLAHVQNKHVLHQAEALRLKRTNAPGPR